MPRRQKGVRSWRTKFTKPDVLAALKFAGLAAWRYEMWSDGDMQFLRDSASGDAKASFEELARLHITFMPLRMVVEAVEADNACAQMLIVTMSWNRGPDAVPA